MKLRLQNLAMAGKLTVVAVGMLAFGYALGPIYNAICEVTGINILALGERNIPGAGSDIAPNTQVDKTRSITVEFDANSRGPWEFKPAQRSLQVHPGELATVVYEFQNVQNRRMAAQAIPSYAPKQAAAAYFNKLECFCRRVLSGLTTRQGHGILPSIPEKPEARAPGATRGLPPR